VQAGGCRGCGGSGSSALNEWRATDLHGVGAAGFCFYLMTHVALT
jgi:hypothetical protein